MRQHSGFTLIETLLAISIFVVASIIIGSLFISHSKLYGMQEAAGSMKLYKTMFAKHLGETGEAAIIVSPAQTIGGIPYTSTSSTVIFKLPGLDASGDIINGVYDYVVFYRDTNTLFMETDADASSQRKDIKQKVAGKVDNLIFKYDTASPANAGLVNGYLYLKSGTAEDAVSVSVYLRNKE
ncbi:type II secretion system GspH family protein [Patescibacteria group bacterium]|nr:type II secretion system GspH family protein [Patescibacteria group bacterium]